MFYYSNQESINPAKNAMCALNFSLFACFLTISQGLSKSPPMLSQHYRYPMQLYFPPVNFYKRNFEHFTFPRSTTVPFPVRRIPQFKGRVHLAHNPFEITMSPSNRFVKKIPVPNTVHPVVHRLLINNGFPGKSFSYNFKGALFSRPRETILIPLINRARNATSPSTTSATTTESGLQSLESVSLLNIFTGVNPGHHFIPTIIPEANITVTPEILIENNTGPAENITHNSILTTANSSISLNDLNEKNITETLTIKPASESSLNKRRLKGMVAKTTSIKESTKIPFIFLPTPLPEIELPQVVNITDQSKVFSNSNTETEDTPSQIVTLMPVNLINSTSTSSTIQTPEENNSTKKPRKYQRKSTISSIPSTDPDQRPKFSVKKIKKTFERVIFRGKKKNDNFEDKNTNKSSLGKSNLSTFHKFRPSRLRLNNTLSSITSHNLTESNPKDNLKLNEASTSQVPTILPANKFAEDEQTIDISPNAKALKIIIIDESLNQEKHILPIEAFFYTNKID